MCQITKGETYGYSVERWEKAKLEAIRAIVREAKEYGLPISYSDLAQRVTGICFDPHDRVFHFMLGQISEEEDAAGRGMLSVLVVHKGGDGMPGAGFWDLAKQMGKDTRNKIDFWVRETQEVMKKCKTHPMLA
ncbi:MAG TPA: hypothetical protein VGJ33_15420 [Candidatus Angelobacter sp.]|jgi:hypothetical protein